MNFDDYQKAWQAQDSRPNVALNADALLEEVRRKQQGFRRMIFWRDVREVGVAAVLVPVFIHSGLTVSWTLHLAAFGCFVVGADMVLDRRRQKRKTPDVHASLKEWAATSLAEVNHQIWLLQNILWNYLLPLGVPIVLFFGWCAGSLPLPIPARVFSFLVLSGFVALVDVGIYWLNQYAVRKGLEPRRQELAELLRSIDPEQPGAGIKSGKPLGPLLLVVGVCITAVILHHFLNAQG